MVRRRWREPAVLFQVLLKPALTHGEGRPRRFPPDNEGVQRGVGGSQPGEGGLGYPWATYTNPKLFLLFFVFQYWGLNSTSG
jgi:hypothetical protein